MHSAHRLTASQANWLLLGLALCVFLIPYAVPVHPAVSVSYVTGFSNTAAVFLFLVGAALYAFATQGRVASVQVDDSPLGLRALFLAVATAMILCYVQFHVAHQPDWDDGYFIQRQQVALSGLTPYRNFEFSYGPLLLFPGVWIARLFGMSGSAAYYSWWALQWVLGCVLVWLVVHWLDWPTRRPLVFGTLLVVQLIGVLTRGSTYTPTRLYCGAFLVCWVHRQWRASASIWALPLAGTLATLMALLVSSEQAIATAIGLVGFACIRFFRGRSAATFLPLIILVLGVACGFGFASRYGLFMSFRALATGGLKFPLLPGLITLPMLFVYLVSIGALYRHLFILRDDSVCIPLVIAGCTLFPYAFGRCDIWHIIGAVPAFVVGVAVICAAPAVRRWWLPFVGLACAWPLLRIATGSAGRELLIKALGEQRSVRLRLMRKQPAVPQVRLNPPPGGLAASQFPCDRTYYSPFQLLSDDAVFNTRCIDGGYYTGFYGVASQAAIDRKLQEFRDRRAEPLLLTEQPLEEQFQTPDANAYVLRNLEGAVVIPPVRHSPLSFQPFVNFIEANYEPGPELRDVGVRVWYRKSHEEDSLP